MDLMATLATAPLRAQNDKPAAGSRNRGEDTATGLSFPSLLENRQTVAEGTRSHRSETTRPTDEQRSATDDRAERDVPVAAADGTKDSVATEQRRPDQPNGATSDAAGKDRIAVSSGVQNQGTVLNAVTPTLTSPFVTIGAEAATQALNTAAVAQESLAAVPGETTPATEPSAATTTATLPVTPRTGAPAQSMAESTTAQTATVTTTVDSEVDAATTPGSGAATAEDRPPSATAAIRLEQLGMTKLRQYAETARSDAAKPQSSTPQSEAVAATDTDPAPQIGAAISAARTATGAEAPVPPATLKPTNESMTNEAPNVSEMAEEDGEPVQVAATVSNTEPRQKLTEHLEHKDVHVKATPEATIDGGEHTASTPHASTEANVARMTTTMATHVTADPTQVRSQVVRHLATGLTPGSGSEKVNIQLNPEALGQVDVEFTAHGDRLSVVITASSGEAEQALREGVRELTDAIMDKAARFQSVDVKVDVRDGQEQKQESRSDQRQDGRRDRSGRDGQSPRDQQNPHDGSAAAKGWAEANEED